MTELGVDLSQRSEGWRQQRAGKITASRFIDVMAVGKKGQPLQARQTYMMDLATERLAGEPRPETYSRSMEWGKEVEPFAFEAYQLKTGLFVTAADFIRHPKYRFIGASPDGLIGDDGGLEMKCPFNPAVHAQTLLEGMPEDHIAQVQGCMFVTDRDWWDFVSYDPRQAPEYRLHVQRIPRDDSYIDRLAFELGKFEAELRDLVKQIRARHRARHKKYAQKRH